MTGFRLVVLIAAVTAQALGYPLDSHKAIETAKAVPAAALEKGLPEAAFEKWFADQLPDGTKIEWEVNDCGEQSGDPEADAGRDLPVCVSAIGRKGKKLEVEIQILVGTQKKGLAVKPEVYSAFVIVEGNKIQEVPDLRLLRRVIAVNLSPPEN